MFCGVRSVGIFCQDYCNLICKKLKYFIFNNIKIISQSDYKSKQQQQQQPPTPRIRMSTPTEQIFSTNVNDYKMSYDSQPTTNLRCTCNNKFCELRDEINYEESNCVLLDIIERNLDFAQYFPDLFIDNVPKEYTIGHFHSIFSVYGDDSLRQITIVPEENTNIVVVKFTPWKVKREMYVSLICMRWNFYNKRGIPAEHKEIANASIYEFDETLWNSFPRFGVDHVYSMFLYEDLKTDPRTTHLYEYLRKEPYTTVLTSDSRHIVDEKYAEYYEGAFEEYLDELKKEQEDYDDMKRQEEEDLMRQYYEYKEDCEYYGRVQEMEEYENLFKLQLLEEGEIDESTSALGETEENCDYDYEEECQPNDAAAKRIALKKREEEEDEDHQMYHYCEIGGVQRRRLKNNASDCGGHEEDPDDLYYRINNAKGVANKEREFWS